MAISVTSRDSGSSTTNSTTYTTGTVTPAAGDLLVVIVCMGGIGADTTSTVSGLSGTWTNQGHFYDTIGIGSTTYDVIVCSDWSGSGTLTLGNTDSATACLWSIFSVTGADNANPVVSGSFKSVQNNSTNNLTITLNAAADADNRPFSAWAKNNNALGTLTPQTSWTEIHEVAIGAPNTTFETQWRSDQFDTAAKVTFSDGTFAGSGIAFEIAVAAAVVTDDSPVPQQVGPGFSPFTEANPWIGTGIEVSNDDVSVFAECPQVSIVSNDVDGSVAVNAGNATATLTANDANKNVAVNAQNASVALIANAPTSSVSVNASVATASFVANNSATTVSPSGSDTIVSFTANDAGHETTEGFFDYNPLAPGISIYGRPQAWSGTSMDLPVSGGNVSVSPDAPAVTVVSNDSTKTLAVNAGVSTVSIAANDSAPSVKPNAGNASIVVTANNPGPSVAVATGVATASFVANNPTPRVASPSGNAVVSFVANNVTASEAANAGNASITVTANNNTPSVSVNAEAASVTLTANQPGSGRTPTTSATAFVAGDVDEAVSVNAGVASVSATANNSTPSVVVNAGVASVNLIAQDATADKVEGFINLSILGPGLSPWQEPEPWFGSHIFISPDRDVQAGSSDVAVTANSPGKSVSVNAGVATVTVSADSPATALKAAAGAATITAASQSAQAALVAYAGVAGVSFTAENPTTKVSPSSESASVLWTSLGATVPAQFLGPPDLIIKKLQDATTINDQSNGVVCSTRSISAITVTNMTNSLIIKKVDDTVTVNE